MTAAVRVLVADDDAAILRACERLLSTGGFEVTTAADGRTAAGLLADQSFDVIVSDISMPEMDGLQLLRRVRERDLDVPVVLVTGTPDVATAIHAIEYGALRYLVKPLAPGQLVEVVTQAARLHQIARLKRLALGLVGEGDHQLGDRAGLDASLDRALATMWMAFQPIVTWPGREVVAFEALLRSTEPTLPHPGAVLQAAERTQRLDHVGRAVRARVAAAIASCPAPDVFVNLHTHDLLDDELYAADAPLTAWASRVVLEITERAALDGLRDVAARIARLRALGYRIAIDDLGAGYAGLTSFAQLEPDIVKFDMSLIQGIDKNATKRRLIQSMTGLFHELGLEVVAEGVETVAERDALAEVGCDWLQGYLFARPGKPFPTPTW